MSAAQKITNPLLDKNVINAFLSAVQKTMQRMANTEVTAEKAFVERDLNPRGEVSGLIGMIAGDMQGTLSITYEKGTIFLIVQNMLGESHNEIDRDVTDAVGELTNMIYGDAKTSLNEQGFSFAAAIPQVVVGAHKIVSLHKGATLIVPFKTSAGHFYIEITLQTT